MPAARARPDKQPFRGLTPRSETSRGLAAGETREKPTELREVIAEGVGDDRLAVGDSLAGEP
jgi:hypothetical protein